MADACIYQDGLQLTQVQRRGQLESLLYNRRGFRAPYVCRLKAADLEESWKLPLRIRIGFARSGKLMLVTVHKNGYHNMEGSYVIDSDGYINQTAGWKEFVAESGLEDGDVVMLVFCREDDSLEISIYVL